MGTHSNSRGIRAKTRGAMRGAMSAAAHAIVRIGRMSIRGRLEQCHVMTETLTESIKVKEHSSEAQLGTPSETIAAYPSQINKAHYVHPCNDELGGNRGEPGRKSFECEGSYSRSESDMVARSVGHNP